MTGGPDRRSAGVILIRSIGAAVLVTAIALLGPEGATACSCAFVAPETMLEQADGAVIARLVRVGPTADPTDFVYRTGRVYKGKPRLRRGRRLVVRSARSSATCGLSDEVGRLTGLFMDRQGGRWHSNLCREVTPAQMRSLDRAGARAADRACGSL